MNRREFSKLIGTAAGLLVLPRMDLLAQDTRQRKWQLSLSEISTVNATFAQDLAAYSAAGFDAIGIWEFKLPNDDSVSDALNKSGLKVANCVPVVPSILPWDLPGMEGPRDPKERIASLCASMSRLAKYNPASVLVITGPIGNFKPDAAHAIVVDGLQQVTAAACAAGVKLGLEPINPIQHDTVSFVNTVADAMAMLKDADADGLGIMADTYNLWNEKPADLAAIAKHVTGLHVADMPWEAGRTDRVLPGEGGINSAALASALINAGWTGMIDVEIFSTPDRFWGLPVAEAAKRAHGADAALARQVAYASGEPS